MVSVATGGSQTENSTPAKNPARGCKARAIQVYQPPADGNTLASWAAATACRPSKTPPNRYAHGVTTPAKPTMNTNDARIANDGPIVAMPCIRMPGRPTAFSRSSVRTLPVLVLPASTVTVSLLPATRPDRINLRAEQSLTDWASVHRSIGPAAGSWQGFRSGHAS